MGQVVDLENFRKSRKSTRLFQSVACPLCDVQVNGEARGDEVVYACYGDGVLSPHNKVEWSHRPDHVAMV